jgi:hypothetical protein
MINEYVSQVITSILQLGTIAFFVWAFLQSTDDKQNNTKPIPYDEYRKHKVEDYVRFVSRINRGQRWLESYASRRVNAK